MESCGEASGEASGRASGGASALQRLYESERRRRLEAESVALAATRQANVAEKLLVANGVAAEGSPIMTLESLRTAPSPVWRSGSDEGARALARPASAARRVTVSHGIEPGDDGATEPGDGAGVAQGGTGGVRGTLAMPSALRVKPSPLTSSPRHLMPCYLRDATAARDEDHTRGMLPTHAMRRAHAHMCCYGARRRRPHIRRVRVPMCTCAWLRGCLCRGCVQPPSSTRRRSTRSKRRTSSYAHVPPSAAAAILTEGRLSCGPT